MKPTTNLRFALVAALITLGGLTTMARAETAYLEITLNIPAESRAAAGAIYTKYKQPFLTTIEGAKSKNLLVRDEDVQVLHGFSSVADAQAYLTTDLFKTDIVNELTPLLKAAPEVRIYLGD